MPRRAPKMVNLSIEETSGVDHPAHLHEGWLVMKGATAAEVADVLDALEKEDDMADDVTVDEVVDEVEAPAEETAAADEVVVVVEDGEVEAAAEDSEQAEAEKADDLEAANAMIEELKAVIETLKQELAAALADDEEGMEVEDAATPEDEDFLKSVPENVRKMVLAARAEKAAAERALADTAEVLRKEREAVADREAVAKAREQFAALTLDPEQVGPALRRLAEVDADLAKAVEDALASANAQSESADIFREIGKASSVNSGNAFDRMQNMAKAAVAEGLAPTVEQAIAQIAVSKPDLYTEYLSEKGA